MLERGTAPSQKPWSAGQVELPFNPDSGKPYRGGNAIHLLAVAATRRYDDPRWMTYRQASEIGAQVRKGERGTQIEFWDFSRQRATPRDASPAEDRSTDPGSQGSDRQGVDSRPIHRIYTVFNANQIDGMPKHTPTERSVFEVVEAAESIVKRSGATIRHDQLDRAFYDRRTDSIHLPPRGAFPDAAKFYGTALHELAHWSGHPTRLNRETLNESYQFGDTNYAREELRAELASVFLAAERGIPHDPEQHAAYVQSWISLLRDDKNEIFRSAREAHIAADYIRLERDKMLSTDQVEPRVETTSYVAHFDPTGAAVSIEDKAAGDQERVPADKHPESAEPLAGATKVAEAILDNQVRQFTPPEDAVRASLRNAEGIVRDQLGGHARLYCARTDSGVYRGEVIGDTDLHTIQRLGSGSAVAHLRQMLPEKLEAGNPVVVAYRSDSVRVSNLPERSRNREIGR